MFHYGPIFLHSFQLILSVFHPRPSLFRVGLERRSPSLETATETDSLMWQSPPPMPEKGVWFIYVEGSKVDSSHLLRYDFYCFTHDFINPSPSTSVFC